MEGISFLGGCFFGMILIGLAWSTIHRGPLEVCERENNVYQCEYVAVPVNPNEVNENGDN